MKTFISAALLLCALVAYVSAIPAGIGANVVPGFVPPGFAKDAVAHFAPPINDHELLEPAESAHHGYGGYGHHHGGYGHHGGWGHHGHHGHHGGWGHHGHGHHWG